MEALLASEYPALNKATLLLQDGIVTISYKAVEIVITSAGGQVCSLLQKLDAVVMMRITFVTMRDALLWADTFLSGYMLAEETDGQANYVHQVSGRRRDYHGVASYGRYRKLWQSEGEGSD